MSVVRRYQAKVIDDIENNKKHQIIMMGFIMPLLFAQTFGGGYAFFHSSLECRGGYQGEIFYIIIFMFEISMCAVFALLFICVLTPTWIKNYRVA